MNVGIVENCVGHIVSVQLVVIIRVYCSRVQAVMEQSKLYICFC